MPMPLLPPMTGKTPPAEGKNVVVCFANINGVKTNCEIVIPAGKSSFKVRPFGSGESEPVFVTLTNGSVDNPGDAWIKFKKTGRSVGYAKTINERFITDWDDNEHKWHCPGIGPQDEGVYVLSNWQDVSK